MSQSEQPLVQAHIDGTNHILAIRFLVYHPIVVNAHATYTECVFIVSTLTALFAFGSNVVSSVPFEKIRAIRFLVIPETPVNVPPIIMLPLDATRIALTCPVPVISAPNVVSNIPVDVKRANLLLFVPLTVVNCQPIITLPSVCKATAFTVPFTFQVNDVSSVPVVVTRAILFIVFLSTEVNIPQITILLSG